ncbi:MAG: dipeptidase PepV [Oscillospiraceae bacterium]|nr:dipeptidase PepV [Oscillospiraceae bacterium]
MNLNEAVLLHKDAMIETLRQNLRIPSVQGPAEPGAPYGAEVRRSLDHALETAEKLGFRAVNVDGHMGWCEFGEGDEMVAVLGHLDVVPAGDGWSCEPYGAEIRDGKIWGRGTTDDKGPSIAALYALAALRDSGLPIRRRIRVLLGCNEETGSADVKYYLAQGGEVPVMGFTPDGEYPVINGEKGIINVTFSRTYTQDGPLKLVELKGGSAPNVVPSYACARFECEAGLADRLSQLYAPSMKFTRTPAGFKAEAFGVSAHGSTPGLGENAIGRLLMAMDNLPLSGDLADAVHFLAEKLGMETNGSSAGIYLRDDVSGELTLNWGTIEGDGEKLYLKINYRYPVTFTYEDCGPKFKAQFLDAGFSLDSEVHKAKLYIPADSQLVSSLMKVYRQQTSLEGEPKCIGGGTYAKSIPNLLAFGPIFPGDEVREHKPDEYISIDNLVKNAQIIAAAMYELAK